MHLEKDLFQTFFTTRTISKFSRLSKKLTGMKYKTLSGKNRTSVSCYKAYSRCPKKNPSLPLKNVKLELIFLNPRGCLIVAMAVVGWIASISCWTSAGCHSVHHLESKSFAREAVFHLAACIVPTSSNARIPRRWWRWSWGSPTWVHTVANETRPENLIEDWTLNDLNCIWQKHRCMPAFAVDPVLRWFWVKALIGLWARVGMARGVGGMRQVVVVKVGVVRDVGLGESW